MPMLTAGDLLAPDALRVCAAPAATAFTPVVGLVGAVVPPEIVRAAGCLPVALMARTEDWDADSSPMEAGHEPEVRSLFRQAVHGVFDALDLIVVPSTSDGYRYLYPYLREMQRQGRADSMPPLLMFDFLFGAAAAVQGHSRRVLQALVRRLEVLAGRKVGEAELRAAVQAGNAQRAQLRALQALRAQGRVRGAEAHRAIRSTAFANPAACTQALAEWIAQGAARAALPRRPRVLLASAVPLYHERLHDLVEACGALVVAEDDEWGARRASPDIDTQGPLLPAIQAHLAAHAVSPRMLQSEREAWLAAQMRSGRFDAVLFYVPPSDQCFGWRYPDLKALADAQGLRTLLLRQDVLDPAAEALLGAALQAFFATVGAGAKT